jgi:hypothetical protein
VKKIVGRDIPKEYISAVEKAQWPSNTFHAIAQAKGLKRKRRSSTLIALRSDQGAGSIALQHSQEKTRCLNYADFQLFDIKAGNLLATAQRKERDSLSESD